VIYLAGISFLFILMLFGIAVIYSFRLGAEIYHAGMRQGPVLPLAEGKKDEEKDEKNKTEEKWDIV